MRGAFALRFFSNIRFAKKKAPIYFFSPQKAKNDDKVTFLERISEKYLVTQRNFCNFVVDIGD